MVIVAEGEGVLMQMDVCIFDWIKGGSGKNG